MMSYQRVLIADTDATTRRVLEAAMQRHGAETFVRRCGGEALATLEEQGYDFDLLLLGFDMPRADGIDVLSAVRSISLDTHVVLFGDDAADAITAGEYGANGFVQKPTNPDEVSRLLTTIRRKASAAELLAV